MVEVAWFKDELSGKAWDKDPSALFVGQERISQVLPQVRGLNLFQWADIDRHTLKEKGRKTEKNGKRLHQP